MIKDDYIMRQIESLVRMLARMVFDKEAPAKEFIAEQEFLSEEENFAVQLFRLLRFGEINEAENLLFDRLEEAPTPVMQPVVDGFYDTLKQMDDDTLQAAGFSRAEIADGRSAANKLLELC